MEAIAEQLIHYDAYGPDVHAFRNLSLASYDFRSHVEKRALLI